MPSTAPIPLPLLRTRLLRLAMLLAAPLAVAGCDTAERTGEIEIYKVAQAESVSKTDRTANTYLLKGRGFSVSENSNRVMDVLGGYDQVGPRRLRQNCLLLIEEANRALHRSISRHEENSPTGRQLAKLLDDAKKLNEHLSTLPKSPDFDPIELNSEEFLERALELDRFLEFIRQYAIDAALEKRTGRELPKFEIIFEVAGTPIPDEAWVRVYAPNIPEEERAATFKRAHHLVETKYEPLFDRLQLPLKDLLKNVKVIDQANDHPLDLPQKDLDESKAMRSLRTLKNFLRSSLEFSMDLSLAVRSGSDTVWTKPKTDDGTIIPDNEVHCKNAIERDYSYVFDQLSIGTEKAQECLQDILTIVIKPLGQVATRYSEERVDLDHLSRELALLTNRAFHRVVQAPKVDTDPVTYVTFILKTLYLRYLGDEKGHDSTPPRTDHRTPTTYESPLAAHNLLVTAALKTQNNAAEAVYPLIFEPLYSPGLFVNRHDRIIYGPAPYHNEFMDLRFTVIELNDVNNSAIIRGFSNMVSAVGNSNPEIAAFSPLVTGLFSAVVQAVNMNKPELDASFTFPAPKGETKPEVDMLMTETGDYVILKRETPGRRGISPASAARMVYRQLIYNAENFKLYRRRYFSNAKANFTPDNLYLDQSYAVISVTDEYVQQDNLGGLLRQQVSSALGEARSKEIIPDLSKAGELINTYHTLRSDERAVKAHPPASEDERKATLEKFKKSQDQLWSQATDLRKQLIVEALYDNASAETQALLVKDPDAWKRAKLTITPGGRVAIDAPKAPVPLPPPLSIKPGADQKIRPFLDRDYSKSWQFQLVTPDGSPFDPAIPGKDSQDPNQADGSPGYGSITAEGQYTSPAVPKTASVIVRARSADNVILNRTLNFRGDHGLKVVLNEGTKGVGSGTSLSSIRYAVTPSAPTAYMIKVTDRGANQNLHWFVQNHVYDTTTAPEKDKIPQDLAGLSNFKITADELDFTLDPGQLILPETLVTFHAVDTVYDAVFKAGIREGTPAVSTILTISNPLSTGVSTLELDKKTAEGKDQLTFSAPLPVVIDQHLLDTVGDGPQVTWTLTPDKPSLPVVIPQAPLTSTLTPKDPITPTPMWPNEGKVNLKGELKGKNGVVSSVSLTIPYKIKQ